MSLSPFSAGQASHECSQTPPLSGMGSKEFVPTFNVLYLDLWSQDLAICVSASQHFPLIVLPGVQSSCWQNYNYTLSPHQKKWKRELNFTDYELLLQISYLNVFSK